MQITAEKIYACYRNTPKNSAAYEQCILGDEVISSLVQPMRIISESTGMPEPLKGMEFFSNRAIVERAYENKQYYKYKNYTDQEKRGLRRPICRSVFHETKYPLYIKVEYHYFSEYD